MPDSPPRSTLYRGGRVRSPQDPFATALLVVDGTVAWVGQEGAADSLDADTTVDLEDAWVAPAFVDAHVHATSTGLALTGLDLTGCPSLAEALRRLADHSRRARGGAVLGTGWDESLWPERRAPTAAELDRASFGGVVYLARTDVHSAVASSALLAACPEARAMTGYLPDGLVTQEAHHAVRRVARESLSLAQRRGLQRTALDRAAALGIACVHECGGPEIAGEADFVELLALEHPVERIGYWGELGAVERARDLGAAGAAGDLFVDGALGSRTACLHEPYSDSPTTTGRSYLDASQVAEHVIACTEHGLQAGFHAIGDAALALVDAGLREAEQRRGTEQLRGARHRVEHLEMPSAALLELLGRLGVVASVQPAFDARWGGAEGMYAERLGTERARGMNPFAAAGAAGVALALGSDSPVTPLDPWGTVRAAVQHRTTGSGISARAAFSAHTRGGWRAARRDDEGELTPGAPATFAVWQVQGELVVQAPDDRVAGWSTDARAGVAGLPDLTGPDPVCLRTVVQGRDAYVRS
ncbi:MAG TPA: amidohydrolase family protein [Mycobacteriales bacterium]|nr:amidohydrolase family protein [Mycobacteriales bacterium]